jgi:hypothetical protein
LPFGLRTLRAFLLEMHADIPYLPVFRRRREMKHTFLLLIVTCLVASCQWTPERDNPLDPNARGYRDPPPANRAPQIDTFYATTHCYNNNPDRVRLYELVCQISDSDNNLGVGLQIPVYFVEDGSLGTMDSLGVMGSDPIRQAFVYRGNKNSLPKPDQSSFTFQIAAVDCSGATTTARTSFVNSWYESYPSLSIPSGTNMPPTALQDTVPRLSWSPLSMIGADHYKITIYKRAM